MAGKANQRATGRNFSRIANEFVGGETSFGQSGDALARVETVAITAQKKSLIAQERSNRKRGWFWRKVKQIAHERLKFIDETGVTTILTRLFGRAAPGERVREAVPKNYGQSTSVVSLIGITGVETTMLVEGAVDTLCFDAFGENFVRPCLRTGDVLVLDNLGALPQRAELSKSPTVVEQR